MSGIKVSEPDTNIDAQSLEKRRAYMKCSDYIVDFALHIKAIHLKEIQKKGKKIIRKACKVQEKHCLIKNKIRRPLYMGN